MKLEPTIAILWGPASRQMDWVRLDTPQGNETIASASQRRLYVRDTEDVDLTSHRRWRND